MASARIVVDRITDGMAVCESLGSNSSLEINTAILPKDLKEGDVLICEGNQFRIDRNTYAERKKKIQGMLDRLFSKNKRK